MLDARAERSRFVGCLLAAAIGDALGAPVEFLGRAEILKRYGPIGIGGFDTWCTEDGTRLPRGSYTDDTQLLIATATGLLRSLQSFRVRGTEDLTGVAHARYLEWLQTQDIPGYRRYPGATCLGSLRSGEVGEVESPINESKGSGGIMRIAPVGLAFEPGRAFEVGAEIAAITHGHESGYLAAGFFADVISHLVRGVEESDPHQGQLQSAIASSRETLLGWEGADEVLEKVDQAVELFIADADLDEAYELLGEGWVAEEALGIALFSALSFPGDFDDGVLASVNITGDSDTTGSLTGALLGASPGVEGIPREWAITVEDAELIRRLAEDLYAGYVTDAPLDRVTYPPE